MPPPFVQTSMSQFLYKGKLSEARVLSIEPFVTTNEALASLDMQKITLANGTTTVLSKAELDKCLSGEPDEVVVVEEVAEEAPAQVEEPIVVPEPAVEAPVEEVKEVSEAPVVSEPVAPVEPVIADQDAKASDV